MTTVDSAIRSMSVDTLRKLKILAEKGASSEVEDLLYQHGWRPGDDPDGVNNIGSKILRR